jgi:hypothetical protein
MQEHFVGKAKYQKGSADEWKRDFHKNLMNHLTGKFDASIREGALDETVWVTPYGEKHFGGRRPGKLQNKFVAAILRAYARAFMWEKTIKLPVVQFMTDSVDVPLKYKNRFKLSKAMGGWDLEAEGTLIFFRTGCYGYYSKKLGWTKQALHAISMGFQDFLKTIAGKPRGVGENRGNYGYWKVRMTRIAESLRRDHGKTAFSFGPAWKNIPGVDEKFSRRVAKWLKSQKL